jgi:hypothetical protein
VTADVGGTSVWQAGRRRTAPPGGVLDRGDDLAADEPIAPVGLGRQLRTDAELLVVAPLAGLLWAYLDGSGVAGWAAATVLIAGVLFWLPAVIGSDPT